MMIVGMNNFLKIINPHFVKNPDVTGRGYCYSCFSLAYAKFEKVELQ